MTILIAHRDLGFLLWLGVALNQTGHTALPVTELAQANSLQQQLAIRFDAVIVEPGLPGVRNWLAIFRASNPGLRVFEATSAAPDPFSPPSIVELHLDGHNRPAPGIADELLPFWSAGQVIECKAN